MNKFSYLFLGDLIETKEKLPLNLFDDFHLKRASKDQIRIIKQLIDNYIKVLSFQINKYESLYCKSNRNGYDITPLKKPEWKYFVIEHSKKQADRKIQLILSLSSLDLTVLFEGIYTGINATTGKAMPGVMQSSLRTINYFHDDRINGFPLPETKLVTKESLDELRRINLLFSNFDKAKFPLIDKALADFVNIKNISASSPFKVLSCFSVLELLLTTYKPKKPNDNSLSNQLQKKINLVNNLFASEIDIQYFFKGSDTNTIETIVEKLYQYRNDIAHGNLSDFEKDLKIFKNQQKNILPFLLNLLRLILITSLEQPQLISDLKDC
jgi:Apea-like HEPN